MNDKESCLPTPVAEGPAHHPAVFLAVAAKLLLNNVEQLQTGLLGMEHLRRDACGDRLLVVLIIIACRGKGRRVGMNQIETLVNLVGVHPDGLFLLWPTHVNPRRATIQAAVTANAPFRSRLPDQVPGVINLRGVETCNGECRGGLARIQINNQHLGIDDIGIGLLLAREHQLQIIVAEQVVDVEGQHKSPLRLIYGMISGLLGRAAVFLLEETYARVVHGKRFKLLVGAVVRAVVNHHPFPVLIRLTAKTIIGTLHKSLASVHGCDNRNQYLFTGKIFHTLNITEKSSVYFINNDYLCT